MATGLDSRHFTKDQAADIYIETADWNNTTVLRDGWMLWQTLEFWDPIGTICTSPSVDREWPRQRRLSSRRRDTWAWAETAVRSLDTSFTLTVAEVEKAVLQSSHSSHNVAGWHYKNMHQDFSLSGNKLSQAVWTSESLAVFKWRPNIYLVTEQRKTPLWSTVHV